MPKVFGKFFIAVLFSSSLIALPAITGAVETNPDLKPKAGDELPTNPAVPATASPVQKVAEPAKVERAFTIGFADIVRIGSESTQGKAAQARLKGKKDKLQTQITARKKQLEKQKAAIEEKLATFTPQQRAVKAKEFEKKIEDYQKFVQNAEKELQTMQEELTRKLFREIEQVVDTYGKANGYAAIIVKKELLYLGSEVKTQDVTDDILKLVNEKG
ncbi:MAG: outer membrane [Geobacteraceae bacterium]|nr:MAG: outer membrane [Geobacteraceae bacterium]